MFRRNRWFGGNVKLIIPPLPPQYLRQNGPLFQSFTFDPKIGDEVALFFLEDPQFSYELGHLKPFNLWANNGVARTSKGTIAFILWSITSRQGHIVDYEHLLNPFNIDTIYLLSSLGQQSCLKVIIVDSNSSEVNGFYEIENVFEFDNFASGIAKVIGHETIADFSETQTAFRSEFTLEELRGS